MPEIQTIPRYTSDLSYLRTTAETLDALSQHCMDLGVAERLRSMAAEMKCRVDVADVRRTTVPRRAVRPAAY
jgi:hypothetical protein